jgi:hypothetical protein
MLIVLLSEGQAGGAWELFNKAMLLQTSGNTGEKGDLQDIIVEFQKT